MFYDAYDDNDHHLGELRDIPYCDEDDEESMDRLKDMLETAIECNDIRTISTKENKDDLIYILTFLSYGNKCNGYLNAESDAFDSMEKCRKAKHFLIEAFTEMLDACKLKSKVHDNKICEITTDDK